MLRRNMDTLNGAATVRERGYRPLPHGRGSVRLLLLLFLLFGCQRPIATAPDAAGPPWFEDVTDAVGLRFVHDPGPVGAYFMPQIVGSGAALFDFDNDGLLDIYLVQNGGLGSRSTNRLFRQGRDGKFTD